MGYHRIHGDSSGGKLRGGSSDESMSDVVEEQIKGETTTVRESGGRRQLLPTRLKANPTKKRAK